MTSSALADHGNGPGAIDTVGVQCDQLDEYFPEHGPHEEIAAAIELDTLEQDPEDEVLLDLGGVVFGVTYSFDDELWVPTELAVVWDDLNTMITAVIVGGDESSLVHFGWPDAQLTGPEGEVRDVTVCAHQAISVTGEGVCVDQSAAIAYEVMAAGFTPAGEQVWINFNGPGGGLHPLAATIPWPEDTYDDPGVAWVEFAVIDPADDREYITAVDFDDPECERTEDDAAEDEEDRPEDDLDAGGDSDDSKGTASVDETEAPKTLPESGIFDDVATIAAIGLLMLVAGAALEGRARRARH